MNKMESVKEDINSLQIPKGKKFNIKIKIFIVLIYLQESQNI